MKKELYKVIEMDKEEYGIIINALNEKRTKLLEEDKDTEIIDELILKVLDAPEKKRYFKRDGYIEENSR